MLVLKMPINRKIYIDGGRIELEVLSVGGNFAKLGFTAPRSVEILREDLCPNGPNYCSRCGGQLPPAALSNHRDRAEPGCRGTPDEASGRCRAYLASTLWGDLPIGPERKEGAA